MFKTATPESAGISSAKVLEFYKYLEKVDLSTHAVIMAKGDRIFSETYWAPFNKDYMHRMYSVSKSFVGIAIGLAEQEGLLSLDDKFIKYFPEYADRADELQRTQTIRDMLTMRTVYRWGGESWFTSGRADRCECYFARKSEKVPGIFYDYDSSGSFMLGAIVERVTGKPFLEYLKEKALKHAGFSEDAYCLTCPGGHSWSDSGVICTARDLLTFAKFVMDKGNIDGKNYINEEYMTTAVSKVCSNYSTTSKTYTTEGYGYQIWRIPENGFLFNGMGAQFAVCMPDKDFILVINSDNQGDPEAKKKIFDGIFNIILPNLGESLPENKDAVDELLNYTKELKLNCLNGAKTSKTVDKINGVKYTLEENPMDIKWIKFEFDGEKGKIFWENKQGEKELPFGMGYNEFAKFPQTGYSDMIGTIPCEGNMYECATSAVWDDEIKLVIKCQIIDKYFGRLAMSFAFNDESMVVRMDKTAEAFLDEYSGTAIGKKLS